MRIAIFTEVFLPKIDGVVTRVTRTLEQLAELGHEVLIFAPGDPPAVYAGFEVVKVRSMSLWPVYPELKYGLPTPAIARRMADFRPDVVHAVNPIWLAAYGVMSARRRDIPLVASFHTNIPEYTDELRIGWVRRPAEHWIRLLHNKAEANLCTSAPMVEKATSVGIEHVQLWPKAVDTIGYTPARRSTEMRERLSAGHPEAPLVIYVGRLSREKNLERLAGIMTRLRQRVPGARLALVGSGPHREQLQKILDPAWTEFIGYLSGVELAEAFASGDAFVFPSLTETLGLVALESMASGVSVVGAAAGGIPFVIDDGETGFLIDPTAGDDAWAEALAVLLNHPDIRARMGEAARAEAERYSWREATNALVEVYQQAITAHAAGSRNERT